MTVQSQIFQVKDLGLVDYREAYDIQKSLVQEVINGGPDTLILCEHPPVLTLGRLADEKYILAPEFDLKNKGVKVLNIDRGGEVTLHAPGQLVVYPICNLKNYGQNLKGYLEQLENVAIALLKDFDILSKSVPKKRGVFVGSKKIASIGIGVKKWVSYHGIAMNVNTDLNLFSLIKPCGLDVQMTSIQELYKSKIDLNLVKEKIVYHFEKEFNRSEV